MSEWRKVEKFVAYSTKGITPKYVSQSKTLVLNQKCIRNNKIDFSLAQYVDDSQKISDNKTVKMGDILFNSTGQGTAGRCAFVTYLPKDVRVVTDSHILVLRCHNFYEAQCLEYVLFSIEKTIQTFMDGSTGQGELDKVKLFNLQVKLPKNEKVLKRISSILANLEAKIELNNRINAQLEQMAKTLYDYWFVQFDFPNKDGKPYKSSGGKMVYNEVLKRETPEGWKIGELGKWIDFKRGISYKSSDIQEVGTPLLSLNSFRLDGSFKIEGTKYFNGNFNDEKRVCFGDLVIAITDVTRNADIIGKSFIVPHLFDEKPLFSCDVASVTATKEEKYYLEMLFNSERYHDYIKHFASGTLVLHLNLDGVRWFITYRPPTELLKKYSAFREDLIKKKFNNLAENQQLTQLRDWLLPMLMNGQVRIKD